jgi:hypothetical protein
MLDDCAPRLAIRSEDRQCHEAPLSILTGKDILLLETELEAACAKAKGGESDDV